ncbi:hypothetical protein BDV39DRAFT_200466 [Aspergillus sergii]|uniref:SnoaL-like domain-containing protein n=1 Tax=Aspergillus sergii TaxID=1034303 RepID=A0A5N6XHM1_9EURO|nr:hypothetical protein BDV39DRAFT_200466 [Aspergillus sergii]
MAVENDHVDNQQLVDDYLSTPFWETDHHVARLFSSSCTWEFPYGPPGMPQIYPRARRPVLIQWLRRTMRNWSRSQIRKYPTKDFTRFWVESSTAAMVKWGSPFERTFNCAHIELIEITNNKITTLKIWSDPVAYYQAAGIILPPFEFNRNPVDPPPYIDTPYPHPPATEPEVSETKERLFNWYLRPSPDNPEELAEKAKTPILFDPDFQFTMPFMPNGLPRGGDRNVEAMMIQWVNDTWVDWHQSKDFTRDKFHDSNISIVESYGNWGTFRWGANGSPSGYYNDYVIMVRLKDFRIVEFKEYLNPIPHLLVTNVSFPVFPFYV